MNEVVTTSGFDAFYGDGGTVCSTFFLEHSLNDEAPYPEIARRFAYLFFSTCFVVFVYRPWDFSSGEKFSFVSKSKVRALRKRRMMYIRLP